MNVLVTGAKGFIGKNLVKTLETIRDGKNKTRPLLSVGEIYEYDENCGNLEEYCEKADFVFNLAGVNRPKENSEFMTGNAGFSCELLETLEKKGNKAPVMLASSAQASLEGRYEGSEYGKSKRKAEEIFFDYAERTGAKVYVFRFPNVFGKWARPNYNSAVATFCHNIANGLPITVSDPDITLELLYIDDLVDTMLDLLEGVVKTEGKFATVKTTHKITLGEITELLYGFNDYVKENGTVKLCELPEGSFEKKLCSTFLTYLPCERFVTENVMHSDERGSFTELFKTEKCGQFSVNITKPGVTKGKHWHNTKWEYFAVVSGKAEIRMRNVTGGDSFVKQVSGDKIESIRMIPGMTHSIKNISESENLVTVMWSNENFNPEKPDTFFEKV